MIIERSSESVFLKHFWVEAALATENGPKHIRNEDRFVFQAPGSPLAEKNKMGYLFGVIDGCGGTAGGADASEICAGIFRGLLAEAASLPSLCRITLMQETLVAANNEVVRCQEENEALENMACAATIAWFWEDEKDEENIHACIVHVGDTRAYVIHGQDVNLITRDHEEGRVLTQVIGMAPKAFEFDSHEFLLKDGDILLLATDGLWKPYEINLVELVDSNRGRTDLIVKRWLEITRLNGSDDDQTAIAVLVE